MTSTHLWVAAVTLLVTALSVALHYEGLLWMARRFGSRRRPIGRHGMLTIITGLVGLHVTEIGFYGLGLWLLLQWPDSGSIAGADPAGFVDALYLSAVTYSTVGFGDVAPVGGIRFLVATESLIGLMMITWSASFTYLEMSQHWRGR